MFTGEAKDFLLQQLGKNKLGIIWKLTRLFILSPHVSLKKYDYEEQKSYLQKLVVSFHVSGLYACVGRK